MNKLIPATLVFAAMAVFSVPFLCLAQAADGNGVERGDLTIQPNASIPKGLEDTIEATMFATCDLRGADRITMTYVQTIPGDLDNSTKFKIQYQVDFGDGVRVVNILVSAHINTSAQHAVSDALIDSFSSPICQ